MVCEGGVPANPTGNLHQLVKLTRWALGTDRIKPSQETGHLGN